MRRIVVLLALAALAALAAHPTAQQPLTSSSARNGIAWAGQVGEGDNSGWNPLASTTYYMGTYMGADPGTTDGPLPYVVPRAGRLVAVYGRFAVAGTLGSAQNCTLVIRKNSTTDILTVSSTVQLTAATVSYNSVGNSIAVAAGDALYIKFTTGAFVTAPTLVLNATSLYFEGP